MTENGLPLMVLCRFDGRVITADQQAILLLGDTQESATISQIAAKANCAELNSLFEQFIVDGMDGQASAVSVASFGDSECQVSLRRLNGFQSQPLVAVEMRPFDKDQSAMADIGRATNRLIHDFKNQMGGLKLYAAYLKKRFAANQDWAEGLEITDKIIHSLNEMAENASLVTKLTRPLTLRLIEEDFVALVKQAVDEFQPQASARGVKINDEFAGTKLRFPLDSQQMRVALQTFLTRAADLSATEGIVNVVVKSDEDRVMLSISNHGEVLSEQQRQTFFDFMTNERLTPASLKLALARRIIELHGGRAMVLAAEPVGTNILLKFRI